MKINSILIRFFWLILINWYGYNTTTSKTHRRSLSGKSDTPITKIVSSVDNIAKVSKNDSKSSSRRKTVAASSEDINGIIVNNSSSKRSRNELPDINPSQLSSPLREMRRIKGKEPMEIPDPDIASTSGTKMRPPSCVPSPIRPETSGSKQIGLLDEPSGTKSSSVPRHPRTKSSSSKLAPASPTHSGGNATQNLPDPNKESSETKEPSTKDSSENIVSTKTLEKMKNEFKNSLKLFKLKLKKSLKYTEGIKADVEERALVKYIKLKLKPFKDTNKNSYKARHKAVNELFNLIQYYETSNDVYFVLKLESKKSFLVQFCNILNKTLQMGSLGVRIAHRVVRVMIDSNVNTADAGGVTNYFFRKLSDEIVNPKRGLFAPPVEESPVYDVDPSSKGNKKKMKFFKYIGNIIAIAFLNRQILPFRFASTIYKTVQQKEIQFADLEVSDKLAYDNILTHVLKSDPSSLGLSVSKKSSLKSEVVGKFKRSNSDAFEDVVAENRHRFVREMINEKIEPIREQLRQIQRGFAEILPPEIISKFRTCELDSMLSGDRAPIDVAQWKANTIYEDGYVKNSLPVKLFWKVVESFTEEQRRQLLKFASGTDTLPAGGFSRHQKFKLAPDTTDASYLPTAHTCSFTLDLPQYQDEETLRKKLLMAMETTEFTLS